MEKAKEIKIIYVQAREGVIISEVNLRNHELELIFIYHTHNALIS